MSVSYIHLSSKHAVGGVSINEGGRWATFSAITWRGDSCRWFMVRLWAFGRTLICWRWRA